MNLDVQGSQAHIQGPQDSTWPFFRGGDILWPTTHVQFSYNPKGPQEAGSGCAWGKKDISIYQHLLCAWLALGPCWGDCRHSKGCPSRAQTGGKGCQAMTSFVCHVNTSGAGNCHWGQKRSVLLGLQRTCCVHTGLWQVPGTQQWRQTHLWLQGGTDNKWTKICQLINPMKKTTDFPSCSVVNSLHLQLPLQGVQVRSQLRELRFHMPLRPKKKKKKKNPENGKKREANTRCLYTMLY